MTIKVMAWHSKFHVGLNHVRRFTQDNTVLETSTTYANRLLYGNPYYYSMKQ